MLGLLVIANHLIIVLEAKLVLGKRSLIDLGAKDEATQS